MPDTFKRFHAPRLPLGIGERLPDRALDVVGLSLHLKARDDRARRGFKLFRARLLPRSVLSAQVRKLSKRGRFFQQLTERSGLLIALCSKDVTIHQPHRFTGKAGESLDVVAVLAERIRWILEDHHVVAIGVLEKIETLMDENPVAAPGMRKVSCAHA